ncbi:GNAT family protein, partial [Arthrospira platensis SPKY2]
FIEYMNKKNGGFKMLKRALLYKEQLSKKFIETFDDPVYQYYYFTYHEMPDIENTDWNYIQFVSIDRNNDIVGYLSAAVGRSPNIIMNLSAINFKDPSNITFSKDAIKLFEILFTQYNFRKVKWSCMSKNPALNIYKKVIKKYGGRIVGKFKDDCVSAMGQLCDLYWFEITRDEYLNSLKNNVPKKFEIFPSDDMKGGNPDYFIKNKESYYTSGLFDDPKNESGLFISKKESKTIPPKKPDMGELIDMNEEFRGMGCLSRK